MKQNVRSYSLGLLTATIILAIVYFINDDEQEETTAAITTEEAIEQVENDGYFVYEEERSMTEVEPDTELNEPEETTDAGDEDGATETSETDSVTIVIEGGMGIIDILALLEENDLLDDRQAFLDYLEQNDLSRSIQAGEFEVSTSATPEEVADTVTGQTTE